LPSDLKDVLSKFDKVVLPELNRGQLNRLIRAEYLIDTISLPKIQGKPYGGAELFAHFQKILNA
jgi:2-oxoglutarate ferredoxin oxidoreductase subunit alpha